MTLKKQSFNANEEAIFEDAVVYKRGQLWQMRMWLTKERKYARFSLKTRNKSTAVDKAKLHYHELKAGELAGKSYFSITTKIGVERYVAQRQLEVGSYIVKGRLSTIKTHLEHWLEFIQRDTKLKELERTDCENYYLERVKGKKKLKVSQTTVANEQSTINSMMRWLFKRNETYIDGFDFKKLPKIDTGDEANRRNTFTDEEIAEIKTQLEAYIAEAKRDLLGEGNISKAVVGYYLLISIITGLRRGEQIQLKWNDIEWLEKNVKGQAADNTYSLVKIRVRSETSKVQKTRRFVIKDWEYFDELLKLLQPRYIKANKDNKSVKKFSETLVFSTNAMSQLTPRAIGYHFDKIMELAEIQNMDSRNLVPYSFRHYFITDMINKGATPTQVAETCGTSTLQIENVYYHTTEAKMITNALPNFEYRDDMLVPK